MFFTTYLLQTYANNAENKYRSLLVWTKLLIICFILLLHHQVFAKLVLDSNDPDFQNATTVTFNNPTYFTPLGVNFELTVNGVDFIFESLSGRNLTAPGTFLSPNNELLSFSPDGVRITFSQPLSAIGLTYDDYFECGSPTIEIIGSLATESFQFTENQLDIFVGASQIGDITELRISAFCGISVWSDMRFVASQITPPTNFADLVLIKTGPAFADQDDFSLDYSLRVENLGPDEAQGVEVFDFPPSSTTFISNTPDSASLNNNGQTITIDVGPIPSQESQINVLSLSAPPFFGVFSCNSRLLNIARVTSDSVDTNTQNNLSTFITEFDPSSRQNQPEICTNNIDDNCDGLIDCADSSCANTSACRAPQLSNRNNFPCGLFSSCGTPNPNLPPNIPPIPFPINPGDIPLPPAPNSCTLTDAVGASVNAPACCCSHGPCDRQQCASLRGEIYVEDPNIKVANPPVNIGGYGVTRVGELHEYAITYENIGTGIASNVQIFDPLSPHLDESTLVIEDGGVFDITKRMIVWTDPSLPPLTPRTVRFSVNVREDAAPGTRIRNQATVFFPEAEVQRVDTNFVEHAIEDPAFPPEADLGVVACNPTNIANEFQVVLYNRGVAFAHNVTAVPINLPSGIIFQDDQVLFGREDDSDTSLAATVVPLGTTYSLDTVTYTADTTVDICPALTWEITYESSDGEALTMIAQAGDDADQDGVADIFDNCPNAVNLDQRDQNQNGIGDVCDTPVIDICGDIDNDQDVDISDRNLFFSAFRSTTGQANFIAGADFDENGKIDFADYQRWYQCYRDFINQ